MGLLLPCQHIPRLSPYSGSGRGMQILSTSSLRNLRSDNYQLIFRQFFIFEDGCLPKFLPHGISRGKAEPCERHKRIA